jgi:hypothetical protein
MLRQATSRLARGPDTNRGEARPINYKAPPTGAFPDVTCKSGVSYEMRLCCPNACSHVQHTGVRSGASAKLKTVISFNKLKQVMSCGYLPAMRR